MSDRDLHRLGNLSTVSDRGWLRPGLSQTSISDTFLGPGYRSDYDARWCIAHRAERLEPAADPDSWDAVVIVETPTPLDPDHTRSYVARTRWARRAGLEVRQKRHD